MPRHDLPSRRKRRLAVASVAALALIGTTVTIGVIGFANAGSIPVSSRADCISDAPPASSSVPGPPPSSAPTESSSTATQPPPASSASTAAPPAESSAPTAQPSSSAPTQTYGLTGPAAAQPTTTAPDAGEAGAPPATQAPTPPDSATMDQFGSKKCNSPQGPFAEDFINIRNVQATNLTVRNGRNASRGSFTALCGNDENEHRNPDNFIVAPGKRNGAQHTHDYVGNLTSDGFSTNDSLAAAGTTCRRGDLSAYYWPVLRVRAAAGKQDVVDQENPHNVGTILALAKVQLTFHGNAKSKVVAMPRFLRDITGDAKAAVNGGANANAKWTCTGFTNRITTKYPVCPRGSSLVRILDFPSCWDGQNIDSANHRDHIKFADKAGQCPAGTKAVPALQMRLTYNIPRGVLFALDAFPDQLHNPVTDHGDFVNVMPDSLMARVVRCINSGQRC